MESTPKKESSKKIINEFRLNNNSLNSLLNNVGKGKKIVDLEKIKILSSSGFEINEEILLKNDDEGTNFRKQATTIRNIFFQLITTETIAIDVDFAAEEEVLEIISQNDNNIEFNQLTFKTEKKGEVVTIDYSKDKIKSFNKLPKSVIKKLFDYQKEGVKFALKKNGRLLLADEMG